MGPPGADQHLAGSLRAADRNLTGRGCSFVHRADPGCPSDDAQKRRSHPVRHLGLGDCADDSAVREPGDPDCHGCTFNARGDPAAAEIQDAYRLIAPLIGVPIASFCSRAAWRSQNSAVTATLAGRVVMEGFLELNLPPVGFAASSPGCSQSFRRSSSPRSIVIVVSANC